MENYYAAYDMEAAQPNLLFHLNMKKQTEGIHGENQLMGHIVVTSRIAQNPHVVLQVGGVGYREHRGLAFHASEMPLAGQILYR